MILFRTLGLDIRRIPNPKNILMLSIFLGFVGADRFAIGGTLLGFFKLFGGCFVWYIVDCGIIQKETRKKNLELITLAVLEKTFNVEQ